MYYKSVNEFLLLFISMISISGINCSCNKTFQKIFLVRNQDSKAFVINRNIETESLKTCLKTNIDHNTNFPLYHIQCFYNDTKLRSLDFKIIMNTINWKQIWKEPLVCETCSSITKNEKVNITKQRFIYKKQILYNITVNKEIFLIHSYKISNMKGELKIYYPIKYSTHNRVHHLQNFHNHKIESMTEVIQTNKQKYSNFPKIKTRRTSNDKEMKPEFYFRYFENKIIECIDNAKNDIIIAVYNIANTNITDALIKAHKRGVFVNVLSSYKCLFAREADSYLDLLKAGIPVNLIIHRMDNEFEIDNSMHTKFAVFDQQYVLTGSVNWETLSSTVNEEVMMYCKNTGVAQTYTNMFCKFLDTEPIYDLVSLPSNIDIYSTYNKSSFEKLVNFINKTKDGDVIYVGMFIFMKLTNIAPEEDVMKALENATNRGVFLNLIVEGNTNSNIFGQYYKRKIPINHYLNEIEYKWKNTNVFRIQTYKGNNQYAAIHHKFITIDYKDFRRCKSNQKPITIFGSANWWDISFSSEDDLVIVQDENISNQFIEEWKVLINPSFTVNGITNLRPTETIWVSITIDNKISEHIMNYGSEMNEYYCSIPIFENNKVSITNNIEYRYFKKYLSTKYYDLPRLKTFQMYKLTDTWGQKNLWNAKVDDVVIL